MQTFFWVFLAFFALNAAGIRKMEEEENDLDDTWQQIIAAQEDGFSAILGTGPRTFTDDAYEEKPSQAWVLIGKKVPNGPPARIIKLPWNLHQDEDIKKLPRNFFDGLWYSADELPSPKWECNFFRITPKLRSDASIFVHFQKKSESERAFIKFFRCICTWYGSSEVDIEKAEECLGPFTCLDWEHINKGSDSDQTSSSETWASSPIHGP
jgi:hypothetical protein